jgi:2-polyprenyl-6-methoxyphenol hydroxylase-like FAD-dependent oxidoreductase
VERYDAIVVGARCAGATLAAGLAGSGWRVLMLDKNSLGSDTLSTHLVFPNTIARLQQLGILDRLSERHRLRPVDYRVRMLGREFTGRFTPVDGHERCLSIRRSTLDRALAEAAIAAGAEARFEEKVTDLLGGATDDDPIRGVVLASGERIAARWVFGADGRASFVARKLGLAPGARAAGDVSMMLSYWHGLPASEYVHLDLEEGAAVNRFPCEDGVDLLLTLGSPDHASGDRKTRERKHLDRLREFPETIDAEWLDQAERISDVRAAPETMLRGFFKQPVGPGWALLGDAGHFKHPGSAQGICDAIEHSLYVAEALNGEDPHLRDYCRWRDARAAGHYEWSFTLARLPRHGVTEPIADGLRDDPVAAQDFRDTLTRSVHPSDAFSSDRLEAWFAAAAPAS